jgi:homoserine/homoserine lactone efflux protein
LRTLLAKSKPKKEERSSPFLGAMGVTLLNPKIIGFFIAFFPQFLNQEESLSSQLALLGPLFLLIVFLVLLAYALFADRLLKRGGRGFQIATGLSLIACGAMAL